MNSKALNREFTNNMKIQKKNFNAKSGFTDSEEDDEDTKSSSFKSPTRSQPLSGRSSLLSARSPRDEGTKIKRLGNYGTKNFDENEDERTLSSPRKQISNNTRFSDNLSPKSPRVDSRMIAANSRGELPRFNQNTSSRSTRINNNNNEDERITPRSSRSTSEKDDFNMLSTIRQPMNDMAKTMHHTSPPSKRGSSQRTRGSGYMASHLEKDVDEEELNRSRSHSSEAMQRRETNSLSPIKNDFTSPKIQKYNNQSANRLGRDDILDDGNYGFEHDKEFKRDREREEFEIQQKEKERRRQRESEEASPRYAVTDEPLDQMNKYRMKANTAVYDQDQMRTEEQNEKPVNTNEKDPEVIETLENSNTAKKLKMQREEKRIEREKRARTQTDSTKKIENAIEILENTMEDSMRLVNLQQKSFDLKYPSKPKFDETKVMLTTGQQKLTRSLSARGTRSGSVSKDGLKDKYAHIKPKTMTRLPAQTARTDAHNSHLNETTNKDCFNDSSSLRENIYNEWYLKKMAQAKEQLKHAQIRQRDDEEAKAQELINKLEKSQVEYKKWAYKKEVSLQNQKAKAAEAYRKAQDEKALKQEQRMIANKAFEQWSRLKIEKLAETRQEKRQEDRVSEKKKRGERVKKAGKPPLPFEAWNKRKEEVLNEKVSIEKEKARLKEEKEKEKEERKKMAEISYLEWLDRKEMVEENKTNLNRSTSVSMNSIVRVPFYPNSRTIPFGR